MMKQIFKPGILVLLGLMALTSCTKKQPVTEAEPEMEQPQEEQLPEPLPMLEYMTEDESVPLPEPFGRGINLGDVLEAPREGNWGGGVAKEEYFPIMKEGGFETVRIPIRWTTHCEMEPPYTILPEFSDRIVMIVGWALAADLKVIIDVHHFKEILEEPDDYEQQLLALWDQICILFPESEYPVDRLYFELLNEPNSKLTPERWNAMIPGVVDTIRSHQSNRVLIVGGGHWNSIDGLLQLELPENIHPAVATFHYYDPMWLTHQGAEWADGYRDWDGMRWRGTEEEIETIRNDFDKAAQWSAAHDDIPLLLGEFGVYARKVPMVDRANWTAVIAREAEKRGISWTYWEFGSGFSAYDRSRKRWKPVLIDALNPSYVPPGEN